MSQTCDPWWSRETPNSRRIDPELVEYFLSVAVAFTNLTLRRGVHAYEENSEQHFKLTPTGLLANRLLP